MTDKHLRQLAAEDFSVQLVSPPCQKRGRERQQALIEAGLRLTSTRTWAEVTVADIAAAIGCSVGTFYTRFHTKETYFNVLQSMVAEVLEHRADAFHAAPQREEESAFEFIASWVGLVVRSFCIHRGLYAAAVLQSQLVLPEDFAQTPLVRLRVRSRDQFVAAMGRHPGWRTAAARRRLGFAHQMLHGVLVNAVLSDPGPLHLDEPALCRELSMALRLYLGLKDKA